MLRTPNLNYMDESFIQATSAVYRVLDFLPDGEPLKAKAKEKALAVLDATTMLFDAGGWVPVKGYFSSEREKMIANVVDDIHILENYLQVAKHQGWLSDMNVLIITKEYEYIKRALRQSKLTQTTQETLALIAKKDVLPLNEAETPKEEAPQKAIDSSKEFSDRQKKIVAMLKQKLTVQVADIIKEIPNITKRTVRRDLDDLLKKQAVERVGEWNKASYKLGKAR